MSPKSEVRRCLPHLFRKMLGKCGRPHTLRGDLSRDVIQINWSRSKRGANRTSSTPLECGGTMKICLQVRRYRILFILSSGFFHSLAALFNFVQREIRCLLEICNQHNIRVPGEIRGFLGEAGKIGITERCFSIEDVRNSDCSCGVLKSQRSELYPISGGEGDLVGVAANRPTEPYEETPLLAKTSANSLPGTPVCEETLTSCAK